MKYSINLVFVLATLLITASSVKLFLIGGALDPKNSDVLDALASSTSKIPLPNKCDEDWMKTTCPRIAVVTSAAATEADGNDAFSIDLTDSPSYYTLFKTYGITARHISAHIDNYQNATNNSTALGLLNQNIFLLADIVFFNGGDQSRHARTWLNDNGSCNTMFCKVMDRYNKGQVVFSGTSAGLAILCNPTFGQGSSYGQLYFTNKVGLAPKLTSDGKVNGTGLKDLRNGTNPNSLQYTENGGKMPGFDGIGSDYLLDSHFDARGRLIRFVPAIKDTNKKYGIASDQNTAIFVNNQIGKVYGANGVFIIDSSAAQYTAGQFFKASNIRVHYLTTGDSFNFSTFTLTSSKPIINTPYYSNTTNSNNITASYECTLLLTRLVDQKGASNIGKTSTPTYFPKSTPIFSITFNKDSLTKGFYSNKKYSVTNALLEYSYAVNQWIDYIQMDQNLRIE